MLRPDAPTKEFDLSIWVPPVETRADLWDFATVGQLCFVKSEGQIYRMTPYGWSAS